MKTQGRSLVGRATKSAIGVFAIVAATTVGFAVGDALAAPQVDAATIAQHSDTPSGDARGVTAADWRWGLAPGKTIEIEGVTGSIRAVGTRGGDVVVHARKRARHSDPDEVTVEVLRHEDGITLCVRYPDVWGSRRNVCAPHGRSHMSTRDNDVAVDFELQVPEGVRFVGRTITGSVEGRGLGADAEGRTVTGSVTLETRGCAEASTVTGSVRVRMGRLRGDGSPLEFKTVTGGVTVEIPEDADAEVAMENVTGGVESEFPMQVRHAGIVGHRLSGTLGHGGPRLRLETVTGSLHLLKMRSF